MSHYYEPSKRFSLGGVLLVLLVGPLVAALLAVIYVYAVWYIPFIYINVLFTVGFGVVLGAVISRLVKAGKLRYPGLVALLALGVGLVACYLQWALYLTLIFNTTSVDSLGSRASVAHTSFDAETLLGLLVSPGLMLSTMAELAKEGSWSIFKVTPTGFFLYLIWLIEAGIIVGATVILGWLQAKHPFSEAAHEWAEDELLPGPVAYLPDADATKAALEAGDFSALQPPLPEAPGHQFARLKLHCAPNDPECAFLSLENVTVTTDAKGKTSESTTNVVEHLRVSAARCQELRGRYHAAQVVS